MAKRVNKFQAQEILNRINDPHITNYYTLRFSDQDMLADTAKIVGYRKPKNANGSLSRYFFEYLKKIVNRS